MDKTMINSRSRIAELDGIRGIAILMVLVWHYFYCQGAGASSYWLAPATSMFWSGVDLFFVLSGVLIGGIIVDNMGDPGFYRTFFIRRAARIVPLYVLLVGLHFFLQRQLDQASFEWLFRDRDKIPIASYLCFTQNLYMGANGTFASNSIAMTWSLAVEEQFYLLVSCLLLFGTKRFSKIVVVLAVVSPFLRLAFPWFMVFVNMPFRMDSFLLGVLVAIGFRRESFVKLVEQTRYLLWVLFGIMLSGVGLMSLPGAKQGFLELTAIAGFYALAITLAIAHRGQAITSPLRSKILTGLGKYSYGIYMYHQMFSGLIHGYFRRAEPSITTGFGALLTLATVALVLSCAVLSYHYFETIFLHIGRRFTYTATSNSNQVANHHSTR
jgi:peptidoglycan/LPS O-acetylase OafA/YrhL